MYLRKHVCGEALQRWSAVRRRSGTERRRRSASTTLPVMGPTDINSWNSSLPHWNSAMVRESSADPGDANPYALGASTASTTTDPSSLSVPTWIAIACCIVSLGFWMLALIVSLPYGHPNAPPLIEIVGFAGSFMVLPALGLAGGVSMLRRKHYALCLVSASGMMVPLLGPCFGLTLPLGIWLFVLLRSRAVRGAFARSIE